MMLGRKRLQGGQPSIYNVMVGITVCNKKKYADKEQYYFAQTDSYRACTTM